MQQGVFKWELGLKPKPTRIFNAVKDALWLKVLFDVFFRILLRPCPGFQMRCFWILSWDENEKTRKGIE